MTIGMHREDTQNALLCVLRLFVVGCGTIDPAYP
jgi:hypothetical protein